MDSKGTVALATGLGALGVIAAYYGYSHINNDDDEQTKPSPPTKESAVGSTAVLRERAEQQKTNEKQQQKTNEEQQQKTNEEQKNTNEEKKNIEQNVKLAISELKEKRKVESQTENLVNNNNNNNCINSSSFVAAEEANMSKSEKTDGEKWREYWAQQFVTQTEKMTAADYN
jgi:hypothetical protein